MLGKNGVHKKDVKVTGMISDDNIGSIRKRRVFYFFDKIETTNAHCPAPENK